MCGRYSDAAELTDIRLTFEVKQVELFREWKPTYNITPSYRPGFEQLMVVATREGERALRLGRFWMIPPSFGRPLNELLSSFNARGEELAKKPLWRAAFRGARCLVPATGWREFTGTTGHKQPHHFHLGHSLLAFAGLSSRWTSPEGEVVDSFAIVTTAASPAVETIHDRMPLVLPKESYGTWLDAKADPEPILAHAIELSRSLPLEVYPSDPVANSGRYEGPRAIERVEALPPPKLLPVQGSLFGEEAWPPRGRRSRP
jgi:putative SOS response-associated peptidase YedK